jgi:hypothetical protein
MVAGAARCDRVQTAAPERPVVPAQVELPLEGRSNACSPGHGRSPDK